MSSFDRPRWVTEKAPADGRQGSGAWMGSGKETETDAMCSASCMVLVLVWEGVDLEGHVADPAGSVWSGFDRMTKMEGTQKNPGVPRARERCTKGRTGLASFLDRFP